MVTLSGGLALDFAVLNYAKYIKKVMSSSFPHAFSQIYNLQNVVSKCPKERTVEEVGPGLQLAKKCCHSRLS